MTDSGEYPVETRRERLDSFSQFRFNGLLREQQWQPEHEQPHEQQLGAPRSAK